MKTLLDLIKSAADFAFSTIDAQPGAELTSQTAEAFKAAGGTTADWPLWSNEVDKYRRHYQIWREQKSPGASAIGGTSSTIPKPKA